MDRMKTLNKVISVRKSFQGAWVISIERPDNITHLLNFSILVILKKKQLG